MSNNYGQLFAKVIAKSVDKTWENAVNEWDVIDCEEDPFCESSCICGKEHIMYLFTIKNKRNGNEIFPIGSSCIKKFLRDELNAKTDLEKQFLCLIKAVKNKNFIKLKEGLFSRKLLKLLYDKGAFNSVSYNPYNSYKFMLDMFNKRDPLEPKDQKRVDAIILNEIKPFAAKYAALKIRSISKN